MSRKYRQRGYQDNSERKDRSRSRGPRPIKEGPKAPRMAAFQKTVRCATCGRLIKTDLEDLDVSSCCPGCQAPLHTCTNCASFDPSSRFECSQPIAERINPKDKANECELFEIKTRVEKEVSSSSGGPDDARQAFDDLFK